MTAHSTSGIIGQRHVPLPANCFTGKRVNLRKFQDQVEAKQDALSKSAKEGPSGPELGSNFIQLAAGESKVSMELVQNREIGDARFVNVDLLTKLRELLKKADAKARHQDQLIKQWEEQVDRVGRTFKRSVSDISTIIGEKLQEVGKRIQYLSSSEAIAMEQSMEEVKAMIMLLNSSLKINPSPEKIDYAVRYCEYVLANRILLKPDGELRGESVDATVEKMEEIIQQFGEVRVKYIKEELFENAINMLEEKHIDRAIEILEDAAHREMFPAKVLLVRLFCGEQGGRVDYDRAFRYAHEASLMGEAKENPGIMKTLGDLYKHGRGVAKDPEKALSWYIKAANNADVDALDAILATSNSELISPEQMVFWAKRGEQVDLPQALLRLGVAYTTGVGEDVDFLKGLDYLRRACALGNAEAFYHLGVAYHYGRGVPADVNEAVKNYRISAENDFVLAQITYGYLCESGTGVPRSLVDARHWYARAAAKGDVSAMVRAAFLFEQPDSPEMKRDPEQAFLLYQQAADLGDVYAKFKLGDFYFNGTAVQKDEHRGVAWYKIAASEGHGHAMVALARCYIDGICMVQDFAAARDLLEKAKDQNIPEAYFRLAMMYVESQGVAHDVELAKGLLRQAAQMGSPQAKHCLQIFQQRGFFLTSKDLRKTFGH